MSILSLITVRKGSKGAKNKCERVIGGKMVFEYTVEYSLRLERLIDGLVTVVSSDSDVLEEYCSSRHIHFVRRSEVLASDSACIEDVILNGYNNLGRSFDYISLLYGNIPVRHTEEFMRAYDFLEGNFDYDAALSMQVVGKYNPAWMFELDEDVLPGKRFEQYRRQDLAQLMIHDGHTVLFRSGYFLEYMRSRPVRQFMYDQFGKKIKPVINDRLIVDIDSEKDFALADAVLS